MYGDFYYCSNCKRFLAVLKYFLASLLKCTKIAYPGDPLEDFQVLISVQLLHPRSTKVICVVILNVICVVILILVVTLNTFVAILKYFVASLLKRTKIAYPGEPLEDFQVLVLINWFFSVY